MARWFVLTVSDRRVRRSIALLAMSIILVAAPVVGQIAAPRAEALRDEALHDEFAWDIVEGLTTEVGQRMAGTEAEKRAREWGLEKLKSLGFSNVRVESFDVPGWTRGDEKAEIVSPYPQTLGVTALGNSASTPPTGLVAEVVGFDSVAALQAASDSSVTHKIVFVSHAMAPTQNGLGYDYNLPVRLQAPSIASRKGAAAIVIRSLGTGHHRDPHAGNWTKNVSAIPAGALSIPDAEQLQRMLKRGKKVMMRLTLNSHDVGVRQSGNIIAEIPGSDPAAGLVLVGGHLDSWDPGTGAFDDAAGIAIATAAAKRVMDSGRPLRTIRLVWFGAEEIGVFGGAAYFAKHGKDNHALISEADAGADRIWRFDSKAPLAVQPMIDEIAAVLAPLGIAKGSTTEASGSDIKSLSASGVPTIEMQQDLTRYFDYHHTRNDTLDKIDPSQLRQNVAAWTAMLFIAANAPELGSSPRAK